MIFFLATNLRSAKSFKSSILHLIRRKPRILVSYDDPFQAGNSLVGSPSMNPKTWIHKPPTLPPTARQRQGPSRHVSTLLRAGLGHRHNGTEVFWNAGDFHLLDLLFDISCWHRHLWWHESTIVTSAFHPQKTSQHQFFLEKKNIPKRCLVFGREWKWNHDELVSGIFFFEFTGLSVAKNFSNLNTHLQIHIIESYTVVFFFHVFVPSLDDFCLEFPFATGFCSTKKSFR